MVCSLANVNAAPESPPAKDLNKQGHIFLMPFPHYRSECLSSVDIICTQKEKQQSAAFSLLTVHCLFMYSKIRDMS